MGPTAPPLRPQVVWVFSTWRATVLSRRRSSISTAWQSSSSPCLRRWRRSAEKQALKPLILDELVIYHRKFGFKQQKWAEMVVEWWCYNWDIKGQYLDELDHDLNDDVTGMMGIVRGTYPKPAILRLVNSCSAARLISKSCPQNWANPCTN